MAEDRAIYGNVNVSRFFFIQMLWSHVCEYRSLTAQKKVPPREWSGCLCTNKDRNYLAYKRPSTRIIALTLRPSISLFVQIDQTVLTNNVVTLQGLRRMLAIQGHSLGHLFIYDDINLDAFGGFAFEESIKTILWVLWRGTAEVLKESKGGWVKSA